MNRFTPTIFSGLGRAGLTLVIDAGTADAEPMRLAIPPGDEGTEATIQAMRAVIDTTRLSGVVASAARDAAEEATEHPLLTSPAQALFDWMRRRIEFRPDPRGTEYLRHPDRIIQEIVRSGRAEADCDDQTMLSAAMLRELGYEPVIVTARTDPEGDYRHVYAGLRQPFHAPNEFIAFDPQECDRVGQNPDGIAAVTVWRM